MGRLRSGETLLSLSSVFPPLPPTKTFRAHNPKQSRDSSKRTLGNTKSNIPSLVDEDEAGLLSKLCRFPDSKAKKNKLSYRTRQRYASAAKSVRKALVSDLMSHENLDVESMVHKANDAFVLLSSCHADFADMYDAVRAFIAYHCQLLEARKELETNGCLEEMMVCQNSLLARSNEEAKSLRSTRTAIAKARRHVTLLVDRVMKTQKLLKELEEKVALRDKEILALLEKRDELEETHEATKAEQQIMAKEVEEKQVIAQKLSSRCDKAMAGIERTKVLLSSLC